MTRPTSQPARCTVTDADLSPCIRGRVHTGRHHFLRPRRRQPVLLLEQLATAERTLERRLA